MVEFTQLDLIVLLLNLNVITICWLFIIRNYGKLKNLDLKKSAQDIKSSFVIGIGSGLAVFVLGLFAEKVSFYPANFSSIIDFIYSMFIGVVSLTFQMSIVLALLTWIMVYTFEGLTK